MHFGNVYVVFLRNFKVTRKILSFESFQIHTYTENSVINLHVPSFKDYPYSVLVLLSISPNFGFGGLF